MYTHLCLQLQTQRQLAQAERHTEDLEATQEEARKQAAAVQQSAIEAQAKSAEQVAIIQAYTLVAALTQGPSLAYAACPEVPT